MVAINKSVLRISLNCCMIMLALLLSACAKQVKSPVLEQQHQAQMTAPYSDHSAAGWYAVRFSIPWAQGKDPSWYVGTLIAGEIVAPLLEEKQQKIICWRMHRRAVRDKTGHVFSFIFYSSRADAALIYQLFQKNRLLAELYHQQLFVKVTYASLNDNHQPLLADTSDAIWPETMRSTWPFFMMGASQMWLEQIRAVKKETLDESELQLRYMTIQNKITVLWRQQGQHALMHHLSALYSYEPLLMRF